MCVSKNKSLKGLCFISIPRLEGSLCATLKSWAALSIILINKHINKKCLGFLSSDVLHLNAYALQFKDNNSETLQTFSLQFQPRDFQ